MKTYSHRFIRGLFVLVENNGETGKFTELEKFMQGIEDTQTFTMAYMRERA